MADATATKDYDIKLEDVGAAKKRLTVTVPAETIDQKLEESMGTLSTQSTLPGFRKGRAPRALLERRFGTSVRTETRNQVVADAYSTAVEEHKLKPVGEPEPVGDIETLELEPGKPFTFTVEVEVIPDFEIPELGDVEIKKPVIEVADEHVDGELKRQCYRFGSLSDVEAEPQPGDRITGPGTATQKGEDEPFFRHDSVNVVIPDTEEGGRGTVLGLIVEDLAGILKGKKIGDTVTIETKGPDAHEMEQVRGKDLIIEITIREAKHLEPADIADVVAGYGLPSEDVLKEQIRLALENRRDEEQRGAMREQICRELVQRIDFELPEKLSENQAGRLLERQRLEMLSRGGMTSDEVEDRLAEIRAETEAQSRERLKLSFILGRLAEQFEISVTEQEVNGRIAAMAMERGVRPEALRNELVQSGAVGQVASLLRDHKAMDRVIDQVKVTDIDADEWNKLYADGKGGAPAAKKKTSSKKKTTTKKKTTKKKTTKG